MRHDVCWNHAQNETIRVVTEQSYDKHHDQQDTRDIKNNIPVGISVAVGKTLPE